MEFTKNQVRVGGGLAALMMSLAALAQSGCSSDNSAAADGGTDSSTEASAEAGPPAPLGVPLPTCSIANCAVCAGVLGSPDAGITYCTQDCDSGADCPMGLACVANPTSSFLNNQCIKTCTSNADCTAPFVCRSDLKTPGSYCFSPFPAPGTGQDSGTPVPDGGTPTPDAAPDTGSSTPDSGPPDAGSITDASPDDAG